ncbi:MAG: insulinase family protein, partial [Verrucomicrobia bacterium]
MPARKTPHLHIERLVEPLLRENVVRHVLPNGLTVLVRPDDSADVVSVQVWVKTGSIHEAPLLGSGLSHFLEHMLFKGTRRRRGREISAEVQAHGGYINAYTTYDRTVYYIDLPSEHVKVAMDVLADAVFNSTLPADEVDRERDVILREIDMGLDDPDYRVAQSLMAVAFRQHPYRHPIIGYREVFSRLKRADLVAYHKARYIPNNVVLIVAGAVDPERLMPAIEKTFGAFERRAFDPARVPEEPKQMAPRELDLEGDVQMFRAALGFQVPGLSHPDTPALDVVSLILGHGESSVLWQALREKRKLVHTIDVSNWNPGGRGLFYLSLLADPEKGEKAVAAVHEEIERICRRGFTRQQLDKALRQAMVGEINVRRTMSGQASRLGLAEVVVGDVHYPATYLRRLAALTTADLKRVAQTYLQPAVLTSVAMRPKRAGSRGGASAITAAARLFEQEALPNGARLLWRENHRLPKVHIRIVWRGGPLFEEPGRRGATSMLASLMTRDTRSRSAAEVASAIESAGGSFSQFSGNNSFGIYAEVLPDDLDLAIDLLEEAMLHPAFTAESVALEREGQIADIVDDEDDIVIYARRRLRRLFFGEHPFAIPASGTVEDVKAIRAADLRRLHRQLVRAGNTVCAVSGDFPKRLLPKLKRLLTKLPAGRPEPRDGSQAYPAEVGRHVLPLERQQVIVHEAYPMSGLLHDEFYVSEVADELFSGMSSHLFERVREEKGLAYFVRSGRVIGLEDGMFYLEAGTNSAGAREVVKEFTAELDRVRRGRVTDEELDRCRTRLKAARRMGLQSNGSWCSHAALNALYGLPVNDAEFYDGRIDAVTREDLARFARERLAAKNRVRL